MAANPSSSLLALGCEDGTIRILSLEGDGLVLQRKFDRVKSRLLSIAWGPPTVRPPKAAQPGPSSSSDSSDDEDEDITDSWLVTGGSDSCLRKWDFASGRVVEKMGMDKLRGERTLVWSVAVLGDGTIVSGDSLGLVKFWESKTCTQIQSFQGHGADVLCIAAGPKNVVYTSGVDQKISEFAYVKQPPPLNSNTTSASGHFASKWVHSCSRRMHSHDVRALAIWPPQSHLNSVLPSWPSEISPLLASGGLDMSVTLTPAAPPSSTVVKVINPLCTSQECVFEESYHRRMAFTSSMVRAVHVARQARLLLCMRDADLALWRVHSSGRGKGSAEEDEDAPLSSSSGDWEKILDMDLNVETNLRASAISEDGSWLVAADSYETKLFRLVITASGDYKPRRVRDFSTVIQSSLPSASRKHGSGASTFTFSPDSTRLIMSTALSGHVLLFDLSGSEEQPPRLLRRFDQHTQAPTTRVVKGLKQNGAFSMATDSDAEEAVSSDDEPAAPASGKPLQATVLRTVVSADGQWLASTDNRLRTHIFNLDSMMHHCILPSFALPPSAMAFNPNVADLLVLTFPDNTVQLFNVETQRFPSWTSELSTSLLKRLTTLHDTILGISFSPASSGGHCLLWGSTWLCKLPLQNAASSEGELRRPKRRQSDEMAVVPAAEGEAAGLKVVTHYRPIIAVDFLASAELMVVERPMVDVLASLPPAYFRHKYGRS